jgi:hypothetical protein
MPSEDFKQRLEKIVELQDRRRAGDEAKADRQKADGAKMQADAGLREAHAKAVLRELVERTAVEPMQYLAARFEGDVRQFWDGQGDSVSRTLQWDGLANGKTVSIAVKAEVANDLSSYGHSGVWVHLSVVGRAAEHILREQSATFASENTAEIQPWLEEHVANALQAVTRP